jgi:hypothetical protein
MPPTVPLSYISSTQSFLDKTENNANPQFVPEAYEATMLVCTQSKLVTTTKRFFFEMGELQPLHQSDAYGFYLNFIQQRSIKIIHHDT